MSPTFSWLFRGCIPGGRALCFIALGLLAGVSRADPVPSLVVKAAKLCASVDDRREPSGELLENVLVQQSPVSFWTVLSGNDDTLQELRKRGLLPIQHQWFRMNAIDLVGANPEEAFEDPEPIRVGTIRHLAKLGAEVAKLGAFDWRTWSCKRRLIPGVYLVRVVYRDGTAVLGMDGKPCELRFEYAP